MKKIFVIALTIFLWQSSFAQWRELYIQAGYKKIIYPLFYYSNSARSDDGYQLELNLTHFFSEKMAYSTGVAYEARKIQKDYTIVDPQPWMSYKALYNFEYIVIPLQFEYKMIDTKWNVLSMRAGFEFCGLISKENKTYFFNGMIKNYIDEHSISKSIRNVSFGFNYRYLFWKNYFISLSPLVRFNTSANQGVGNRLEGSPFTYVIAFASGYRFR